MVRHIFNTVAAALVSMFIAQALGLPMPQIVMVTVVIVMQPAARQVLDKSLYRLLGTVAGAAAAYALGCVAGGSPVWFLAAVGAWVSLLTFAASFSKQLKAYSIVLAGYTPVLIGVPAVFQLGHVSAHAAERLAEVVLGLACSAAIILANGARTAQPQPAPAPAASIAPAMPGTTATPAMPATSGVQVALGGGRARDALLAALHPAAAMAAMATLWLLTSWRGGPMATLNTTVDCALLALAAQPVRAALQMSIGTLAAVAAAVAMQLAYPVLPDVPHWLLLAPLLALGARATGKQTTLLGGLGYCITLCMLSWPGQDQLQAAAGIALSVPVLTIICVVMSKLKQEPVKQ